MQTPPFLVWSIGQACRLRELVPVDQPEKVERHLRAAQTYSVARAENRVFEGLCIDEPLGFRVDHALAVYGGQAAVEVACRGCPANALAATESGSLAGCFGMLPLPDDNESFYAPFDRAIDEANRRSQYAALFPSTRPRWFGIWMESPLNVPRIELMLGVLRCDEVAASLGDEGNRFALALEACVRHGLPLHGQLYPRGEVQGNWWHVAPHCRRCRTARDAGSSHCPVCGCVGELDPGRKRRARGTRPYFPLARILGESAAAAFLQRYRQFRQEGLGQDQTAGRGGF